MAEYAVGDLTVPGPGEPPDLGHAGWPAPSGPPDLLTGDLVPGAPVLDAPAVDSDLDGFADTTVAPLGDDLVLATDTDHDGHADLVTRVGPRGVVTSRYGPDGRVESEDHPWGAPPPPPPSVDPRTGEWTRG